MNRRLEGIFAGLSGARYLVTSPETPLYNCVAWAASDESRWWWPDPMEVSFWPPTVPREETRESFLAAFATLGFLPCEGVELERGFEKLAIYSEPDGTPTHVARQLPDGRWTSKLGNLEDIEHDDLECLHGDPYGGVAVILKRALRQ